jgi:hypothetical protein
MERFLNDRRDTDTNTYLDAEQNAASTFSTEASTHKQTRAQNRHIDTDTGRDPETQQHTGLDIDADTSTHPLPHPDPDPHT